MQFFEKLINKITLVKDTYCDKVFKNGSSKIRGRQPLKTFTWSILEYIVPNKTQVLTKSVNLDILAIGPLNQLFV